MVFQHTYMVTKAGHSKMKFWSILYTLYGVKQSTTMPYNLHRNFTCERFNHMLHDLLKTMEKELQKPNWPLYLSSLVLAYNATPHSFPGYQPYELKFGHKAPTVCNAWLGLVKYDDQYSQSKSAWVNEQHKLILAVNRWTFEEHQANCQEDSTPCGRKHFQYTQG